MLNVWSLRQKSAGNAMVALHLPRCQTADLTTCIITQRDG
jgi:hypothetical protein